MAFIIKVLLTLAIFGRYSWQIVDWLCGQFSISPDVATLIGVAGIFAIIQFLWSLVFHRHYGY